MPCSKYSGKQRRACYATNEWSRPVRKKAKRKPARKPVPRRRRAS